MKKIMITGAVVALLVSVSQANIISVNVTDYNSLRNSMEPAELAGAPGVRTNNWNNIKAASNTTFGTALMYNDGTTVGGSFQIVQNSPRTGSQAEASKTDDAAMFSGYNQVWNGQTVTYTLTGIPFSNYEIYVYAGTARVNCGGSISLSGQPTYYVKTMSTLAITTQTNGSGYSQITGTDYETVKSGAATKDNYVVYSNLTGSSQTLSVSALDMGDTTTQRLNIFGFQIVEIVPEPATVGLLGFGALVALVIRRIRR